MVGLSQSENDEDVPYTAHISSSDYYVKEKSGSVACQ